MNFSFLLPLILAGIALLASAVCLYFVLQFKKLKDGFFSGKQASSLEEFILNQSKKINELGTRADYIEEEIKNLRDQQKLSIRKIGLTRYNPFADDGGNLSFSMAMLDDHNNGVIITSMHGRDQNRIYAKPIHKGKSEFTLTEEESKALKESKNF